VNSVTSGLGGSDAAVPFRPISSHSRSTCSSWSCASGSAGATGDGRSEVTLDIDVAKMRSDSLGAETAVPMNDWIDIGVFADNDMTEPLYLRKHRLVEGTASLTVTVDREPARAGVDPWHKLIDRETSDNTVRVDAGGGTDAATGRRP
jgi:ABC-2 type transport system permease protein